MDLENRIKRLENRIGVADGIPPLIRIDVVDSQKGSTDPGIAQLAVVPGKIGGPYGFTLFRGEGETGADFLDRAELRHKDFYG